MSCQICAITEACAQADAKTETGVGAAFAAILVTHAVVGWPGIHTVLSDLCDRHQRALSRTINDCCAKSGLDRAAIFATLGAVDCAPKGEAKAVN